MIQFIDTVVREVMSGISEDEKVGGDAEAAAREGGDEGSETL